MRRMTQHTITDRIFGIRQDRQDVAVVGNARRMTGLLRLGCKRTLCHSRRKYHALVAWCSASASAAEQISDLGPVWHAGAFSRLAFVEGVSRASC